MTDIILASALIIGIQIYTVIGLSMIYKSLNNECDEKSSTDITDNQNQILPL